MRARPAHLAALLLLAVACSSLPPPPLPPPLERGTYQAIAVLPFQTPDFESRYGSEVADQLIIELLARDPGLPLVDRAPLEQILETQGLSARESQDLIALGSLLRADLILTGSIWLALEDVNWPGARRVAYATATLRAFEPVTGRIVWAARCTITEERYTDIHHTWTNSELRQTAIEELAVKMAESVLGVPDKLAEQ